MQLVPWSEEKINKIREVTRRQIVEQARTDLLAFTRLTMPIFRVNWHHVVTCDYLNKFVRGEITRLMIFMPPRHTKSELGSRRLPGFIFGQNPDEEIISASYSDTMASLMNRDSQRIIDTPEYQEIFPHVTLSGDNVRANAQGSWLRNSDMYEIVGHRGKYKSAGVGGAITGLGATTIIIDDPIKNQAEADSDVYRNKIWDWYNSTLMTRMVNRPGKPAKILVMLTRWHEDDLAGRLLNLAKTDPLADQWTVLTLPAIKENNENPDDIRQVGEALWPMQNDLESLVRMKAASTRVFSALYQQTPTPDSGLIVQRKHIKYYKAAPTDFDTKLISGDLTFKEGENSDYVVLQVWGAKGADKYLLDQVRAKMSFTSTIAAFQALCAKWPEATLKLVEKAANGEALLDTLKGKIAGLVGVSPRTSKVGRARAVSPQWEAGNVHLPHPDIAPWINDYVEEWMMFPAGKHDDQVDATTQALLRLEEEKPIDWTPISITGASTWRR